MRRHALFFLAFLVPLGYLHTPLSPAQQAKVQAKSVVADVGGMQPKSAVTTPKEHFGFNICDDYCLATYTQFEAFLHKIEKQTDRIKVVSMGKTEEGRDQLMGIVTSPANHAKLDHYKAISRRLALAKDLTDEQARQLANEGKAVIWINGGLHASEVLGAQQLTETIYRFCSATDPETMRILNDVIILFVHANPDGMELCAGSYMKSSEDPKGRRGYGNRLYEKYAGHDNNRDSYACNLAETRNMNRVMYREWFPQMAFDHHQTGPAGAVVFIPPCRDPNNYNLHPMVLNGIEALSTAMRDRLLVENKPGATVRTGAGYSLWWNGGVITTCQFHNMIGIFTETIGGPAPTAIPLSVNKLLPNYDYLSPIPPQPWHFKQSMEYSITTNMAMLDFSSRNRERLLYNIYHMGKDAIEKGNKDNWTIEPHNILAAGGSTSRGGRGGRGGGGGGGRGAGGGGGGGGPPAEFVRLFNKPEERDPRGFIMPSDQPDFLTATRFVNDLLNTGITIHRATADFEVAGKKYPKGSYVVKSAQAFRPHVLDMFEPQDHPDDFAPGSNTPTRPYDIAGYTLAFQMGVKFDRLLEGFDGPFEEIKTEIVPPPPASITNASASAGFFLDTRMNDAFRAVNRLLAAGEDVRRLQKPFTAAGTTYPAGTFFVARKASTQATLEKVAKEVGTPFTGSAVAPGAEAVALKPPRIGLSDTGNSMPAGWTRWVLEQFEFPYKTFGGQALTQGNLRDRYDVLVFVESGVGGGGGRGGRAGGGGAGRGGDRGGRGGDRGAGGAGGGGAGGDQPPARGGAGEQPEQPDTGAIANVRKFIEEGGVVFVAGQPTTSTATQLGLPVTNHLAGIGSDKFYVPGSVLRTKVDPTNWLAWGMPEDLDVMFNNSATYKIPEGDAAKGLNKVAWFDTKKPLRSGWAFGQENLDGGVAVAEVSIGKGKLVLCGPQVLFRGEPDGTFKFLFNSIVQSAGNAAAPKPQQ